MTNKICFWVVQDETESLCLAKLKVFLWQNTRLFNIMYYKMVSLQFTLSINMSDEIIVKIVIC